MKGELSQFDYAPSAKWSDLYNFWRLYKTNAVTHWLLSKITMKFSEMSLNQAKQFHYKIPSCIFGIGCLFESLLNWCPYLMNTPQCVAHYSEETPKHAKLTRQSDGDLLILNPREPAAMVCQKKGVLESERQNWNYSLQSDVYTQQLRSLHCVVPLCLNKYACNAR